MPNVALDILVNVVKTKILLIFISLSSLVFIFVLVLVSSTIIQNVFVIFVIVFVVVDKKNTEHTTTPINHTRPSPSEHSPDGAACARKQTSDYSLLLSLSTSKG